MVQIHETGIFEIKSPKSQLSAREQEEEKKEPEQSAVLSYFLDCVQLIQYISMLWIPSLVGYKANGSASVTANTVYRLESKTLPTLSFFTFNSFLADMCMLLCLQESSQYKPVHQSREQALKAGVSEEILNLLTVFLLIKNPIKIYS